MIHDGLYSIKSKRFSLYSYVVLPVRTLTEEALELWSIPLAHKTKFSGKQLTEYRWDLLIPKELM